MQTKRFLEMSAVSCRSSVSQEISASRRRHSVQVGVNTSMTLIGFSRLLLLLALISLFLRRPFLVCRESR
jgi:hypothetical protein